MRKLRLTFAARGFAAYCAGLPAGYVLFATSLAVWSDRDFPGVGESMALIGVAFLAGLVLFVPAVLLTLLFPRSVLRHMGTWCLVGSLLFSLVALALFGVASSGEVIRIEYLGWWAALCICASATIFYIWNRKRPLTPP